jgi:pyruvate kinase
MIARGDLSVETRLETIAIYQKNIIEKARVFGIPVIVATEMLHTMIVNPFPTKAEVSDITNAILDGAAATMLSGETAVGEYPVEAVHLMRGIASEATLYSLASKAHGNNTPKQQDATQVIEDAADFISRSLPINKIIVITRSDYTARMISVRTPSQPIIAVSNDLMTARSFNLLNGTEGVYIDATFSDMTVDHIPFCLKELWVRKKIVDTDHILLLSGLNPKSGTRMNLLQTYQVSDLSGSLGWKH